MTDKEAVQKCMNEIYSFNTVEHFLHFNAGLQILSLIIRHKDSRPAMEAVVRRLAEEQPTNTPTLYKAIFDVLNELDFIVERLNSIEILKKDKENNDEQSDDYSHQD
jgi:hypothetical protein